MSRELTPKELEYIQKYYNIPNIVDSLVTQIGDTIMPTYTDEQKELAHRYPNLGMFGFDLLDACRGNGLYSNENGKSLLQQIENYFSGINIEDKELASAAQAWYEGVFSNGYYMNDNNSLFADYLKSRISIKMHE